MRRIAPTGRTTALGVGIAPLSEGDVDTVHLATLEVLERTGAFVEASGPGLVRRCRLCGGPRDERGQDPRPHRGSSRSRRARRRSGCAAETSRVPPSARLGWASSTFCEGILMNDLEAGEIPAVAQTTLRTSAGGGCATDIDAVASPSAPRRWRGGAVMHGLEAELSSTTELSTSRLDEHGRGGSRSGDGRRRSRRPRRHFATTARERWLRNREPAGLTKQFIDVTAELARTGMPVLVISDVMAGATAPVTGVGQPQCRRLASPVYVQLATRRQGDLRVLLRRHGHAFRCRLRRDA